MEKQILLDGKAIFYELLRKNVKNINLRIKPNGDILVSANRFVPQKTIENFIISKKDFILKALNKYENSRNFLSSDIENNKLLLFGSFYPIVTDYGKNSVCFKDGKIHLTVKNDGQKEKALMDFYKKECEKTVTEMCKNIYPIFKDYTPCFPEIKFRNMKSRLGSLMPIKNILTFNYRLVLLPHKLIEYVVYHEFCHYIEPNHSKNFYSVLLGVLPDYKERQNQVKSFGNIDFFR